MSHYHPHPHWQQAQIVLSSDDLHADLAFYDEELGFDLQTIYPADDPAVAVLSGFGLTLRLDKTLKSNPGVLCLQTALPLSSIAGKELPSRSPSGTQIIYEHISDKPNRPATQHEFGVRQFLKDEPWVIGRAGMHYRDLIPSRLGGSIIASHIRIPTGGPVPDMVHYHTVGFQLIYCYRGWVRLVYEDQGEPFVLKAGDCVTQPPKIRHRVLEASDGLEVIEIGVPAEHITTIDHDMELPNQVLNRAREFEGQTFCHHQLTNAVWDRFRLSGFEARDSGIQQATGNVAGVKVVRTNSDHSPSTTSQHNADILFGFVLEGSMTLGVDKMHVLQQGAAFTVPPDTRYTIKDCSRDLQWLEVTLPGDFVTHE
ncbi:MAG: cupin domain-containing protein [Gammaproteobacteria bacterium]|nr:cupin domain-containing protein [Gammaproteobacteria bacterium]